MSDTSSQLPAEQSRESNSTICFVCGEVAKPGKAHMRHFGGIVCCSCRAFWRRTHQQTRHPNFVCKRSNRCQITVDTRKKCQKCRYERCTLAGMRPDAVLNEDQKKVRFRNLLKRQQLFLSMMLETDVPAPKVITYLPKVSDYPCHQKLKLESSPTATLSSQVNLRPDQRPPAIFNQKEFVPSSVDSFLPEQPSPRTHFTHPDPENSPLNLSLLNGSPSNIFAETILSTNESFRKTVDELTKDYIRAFKKIRCPRTEHLISKLMALQAGFFEITSLSKSDLHFLMDRFSLVFRLFAYSHSEFCDLNPIDQGKLLDRNAPLFIQLYMSQFLINYQRQTSEIQLTDDKDQKRFLEMFNEVTNLFFHGANLDEYSHFISKLRKFSGLSTCEKKAIVTHIILFSSDENISGLESKNLVSIYDDFIRNNDKSCLTFPELFENLQKMVQFANTNIAW